MFPMERALGGAAAAAVLRVSALRDLTDERELVEEWMGEAESPSSSGWYGVRVRP
jgi:hypothetical protein